MFGTFVLHYVWGVSCDVGGVGTMAEIIYTIVPGKLKELLQKIRTMGVPPKASVEWLKSIGFKSSNDPSMLRVLKGIGLTADDGTPTHPWREYRGGDHKAVLARCIRSGYADLVQTYPDAQTRGNDALGAPSRWASAHLKQCANFRNLVAGLARN